MSDVKLERKEVLSREEAAKQLSALAAALGEAGHVEMELGGGALRGPVAQAVRPAVEGVVGGGLVSVRREVAGREERGGRQLVGAESALPLLEGGQARDLSAADVHHHDASRSPETVLPGSTSRQRPGHAMPPDDHGAEASAVS